MEIMETIKWNICYNYVKIKAGDIHGRNTRCCWL
jgi:hypothetical protein